MKKWLLIGSLGLEGLFIIGLMSPSLASTLYQGLSEDERQDFYHLSTGAELIPYDWFLALEQAENRQPLIALLPAVGLIADPASSKYKDGLPVGLAKTKGSKGVPDQLGVSCAFCHTNVLTYRGRTLRIEGGTTLQYSSKFVEAMVNAVKATLDDPLKFSRFAKAIRGKKDIDADPGQLKKALAGYHKSMLFRSSRDVAPVAWGFGRNDGLGRGGSLVFAQLDPDNLRPANAPMSIPYLWGSWEYDWLQWNGSIQNPISRSIGQVIGVGAGLFGRHADDNPYAPFVDPEDPFASSVNIHNLKELQRLVSKLHPPRWPTHFPPIKRELAVRGRELYHGNSEKNIPNLCAHCHVAKVLDPAQRPSESQQLHVTMIKLEEIGTDPLAAQNFMGRTVETGPLGKGRLPAIDVIKLITTEIIARGKEKPGANEMRAEAHYMARPQAGVWATPPFLHNGSVPNVYELLSPVEERSKCFLIGTTSEYDPVRLGLAARACGQGPINADRDFKFDTTRAGNWNTGHEFRSSGTCGSAAPDDRPGVLGCEIKSGDRWAIIEYLKTCDLERPAWKEAAPCRDLEIPQRSMSPQRTARTVKR